MVVIDTHLHLYPEYDLGNAFRGCSSRLRDLAPEAVCVAALTERAGQHFFQDLADNRLSTPEDTTLRIVEPGRSIKIQPATTPPLYLIAGRQIVTAERLEILCLGIDAIIPDGLNATETVLRIRELGGIAVLTWAVGKWLFKRKIIVNRLLEEFAPRELLLGDSAMRPVFWPIPSAMQTAELQQRKIIAGSDPLPAAGEERVMGTYASLLHTNFDEANPADSLVQALENQSVTVKNIGKRCGPLEFIRRMRAASGR